MDMNVVRLHHKAVLPEYATDGAGAFDLRACLDQRAHVQPGRPLAVGTGLAFEIPEGHAMLVLSRSGHGFNLDIRLANCVGLIDSDYRGELKVKLTADGDNGLVVNHGDRIAQAMVIPFVRMSLIEVDELTETERGEGGLGSTGIF